MIMKWISALLYRLIDSRDDCNDDKRDKEDALWARKRRGLPTDDEWWDAIK